MSDAASTTSHSNQSNQRADHLAELDREIARCTWSLTNRISLSVWALCGVALCVDMALTLAEGRGFQYLRHSFGLLSVLLWLVLMTKHVSHVARLYREMSDVMLDECEEAHSGAKALPFLRFGLLHFVLGSRASDRALARALRKRLQRPHDLADDPRELDSARGD